MHPSIVLSYADDAPAVLFNDFIEETAAQREAVAIEARPASGPFAGVEWLLPTTVFLFITKSYFDAFLKEAGKDHYQVLKRATAKLAARLSLVKATLIGTAGKVAAQPAYSLVFSMLSQSDDGAQIKLLFPADLSQEDASRVALELLDFLAAYHAGELSAELSATLAAAPRFGHTVLASYDLTQNTIVVVDARRALTNSPVEDNGDS